MESCTKETPEKGKRKNKRAPRETLEQKRYNSQGEPAKKKQKRGYFRGKNWEP